MAAFAGSPTSSAGYAQVAAAPVSGAFGYQFAPFTYTHAAGAGTGEVNLVKLPRGLITVKPTYCRIATALTNVPSIAFGSRAHVTRAGATVAEDADSILAALLPIMQVTIDPAGANNSLQYTAVNRGDAVTITYTDPSDINQALAVTVAALDIDVSLATDGAGTITSTAATVKAALDADEDAAAIVTVTAVGTITGLVPAVVQTPLVSVDELAALSGNDVQFDSETGVVVFATIAAADIEDNDTLTGWIAYKIEED